MMFFIQKQVITSELAYLIVMFFKINFKFGGDNLIVIQIVNRSCTITNKMRTNKRGSLDLNSFSIKNTRNYNFLKDQQAFGQFSNMPSPINKMRFDLTSNISHDDLLNYSKDTNCQQPNTSYHKSCVQSPTKDLKNQTSGYSMISKRQSIPDIRILNDVNPNKEPNWQDRFRKYQNTETTKPFKKLGGIKNYSKRQNEQERQNNGKYEHNQTKFYSQNLIYGPQQGDRNIFQSQKYQNLSRNYQQIQQEYQKIKQENTRLKRSKQELMSQNLSLKKQSDTKMNGLSKELQNLKEQIYRMQMQRQQGNSNRTFHTRMSSNRQSSMGSARGYNQQNQRMNPFYVQQLQRQNDQLIRDNRRLNEIVMKRLKHSIAE